MSRRKSEFRPDLALPVELWGTIIGAVDKLTWLARTDAAIAAGMVPRSFLHVAVRIATRWLNKETGLTWRSAENLASDIGMAKSSVEGLLEDAVAAGLLIMVKRGQRGRGKRSTIYRPAMPDVLLPDGPGFKPDALIPGGPGFKPSRKSRLEQPANPGFGANQIPVGRDDLPEEVIPEDIIPLAAEGGANTARGDGSNTTRAERESSTDAATDYALSDTVDDAPIPATDGSVARTAHAALKQPLAEQEPPPPCRATSKKMGRPVNADPAERMRWVQFLNVVSAWPQDHVGDEVSAYAVFSRIMGAGRSLHAVIDAVKSTRLDYDDDPPSLTSVLMTIEHNP